jgi:hypothetical protein
LDEFKHFPQIYFSRYTNTDLPAFIGERRVLRMVRKTNEAIYTDFYDNLNTYMMKVPASLAKEAVSKLVDKRLIFLGKDLDSSKNGIIGTLIINKNALAGVVLEVSDLEINPQTGETPNIDECFYASYFEFIRAAVLINRDKIRVDKQIHELCVHALYYIFLRLLGKDIQFTETQKQSLQIIVTYFFYRHEMSETHSLSVEKALTGVPKDLAESIRPELDKLDKYKTMRDFFSALVDMRLITDSPNKYIIFSLRKLNATGFFSVFTSLDYLISMIIIASYPVRFIGINTINTTIQNKLERLMFSYINKVKFDTNALK